MKHLPAFLLGAACLLAACSPTASQPAPGSGTDVNAELEAAFDQLRRTLAGHDDTARFPRSLTPNHTHWETVEASDWTSGFFPGLLWMAYEASEDTFWQNAAAEWSAGLEGERFTRSHHDLGFMLYNSFGHGHRLTGEEAYREMLLDAAESLASRYDERVGAIRSWDWSRTWHFPVIIDNLLNLELLFWAAREAGNDRYREMAVSHAHRSADVHVREDGSTFHVVDFDSTSGEVRDRVTHQGYSDGSTWARGQAWGIYGFTMIYRETGEQRFLDLAVRLADHFLDNVPDDLVPVWDFEVADDEDEPRDVSAAAITLSALIELAQLAGGDDARRFEWAAATLMSSLSSPPYRVAATDPEPALLRHSVGNRPADHEVDVSLIYSDYYYMEALLRLRSGAVVHDG